MLRGEIPLSIPGLDDLEDLVSQGQSPTKREGGHHHHHYDSEDEYPDGLLYQQRGQQADRPKQASPPGRGGPGPRGAGEGPPCVPAAIQQGSCGSHLFDLSDLLAGDLLQKVGRLCEKAGGETAHHSHGQLPAKSSEARGKG